jgi:hypothetical protein
MRKLLPAILLLTYASAYSQDTPGKEKIRQDTSFIDSGHSLQNYSDSLQNAATARQLEENMNSFMRYRKEQEEKQRMRSILYIGVGVFFLVVLVLGLRRKMKD